VVVRRSQALDEAVSFASAAAPQWFDLAIAHPRSQHAVPTGEVGLHVVGWNDADVAKPPLLLLHGFRANAHWWDHVAPFLVHGHRVFAMDFSGMGLSGRRPAYTRQHFNEDIVAVARWLKEQTPGLPLTVAGHSYGGSRMLEVCAHEPGLIDHAITLDAPVPLRSAGLPLMEVRSRAEPYADRDTILSRFRLSPEQPALPYVRAYIAEHSIAPLEEGGWTWRFDPAIVGAIGGTQARDDELRTISVPVDVVRGARSGIVSSEAVVQMAALLPRVRGPFEIPEAGHHLMLDCPLALVSLLNTLLGALPEKGTPWTTA
jgi:pimeloyl-ACP methyl ester carboxylesterase